MILKFFLICTKNINKRNRMPKKLYYKLNECLIIYIKYKTLFQREYLIIKSKYLNKIKSIGL